MTVFNPLDPKTHDSAMEWMCVAPSSPDDPEDMDEIPSVTVYTELEAAALEKQGYTVFAFPRG